MLIYLCELCVLCGYQLFPGSRHFTLKEGYPLAGYRVLCVIVTHNILDHFLVALENLLIIQNPSSLLAGRGKPVTSGARRP